jgi:hypothetical protein
MYLCDANPLKSRSSLPFRPPQQQVFLVFRIIIWVLLVPVPHTHKENDVLASEPIAVRARKVECDINAFIVGIVVANVATTALARCIKTLIRVIEVGTFRSIRHWFLVNRPPLYALPRLEFCEGRWPFERVDLSDQAKFAAQDLPDWKLPDLLSS